MTISSARAPVSRCNRLIAHTCREEKGISTDTVTQYDAASGGNVIDQIQYTVAAWGNLTKFAVDRNSVIAGGTAASDGYYDVDYAYAKAASVNGGRQTLRKTAMTWPDGTSATYEYLSTFALFDDLSGVRAVGTPKASLRPRPSDFDLGG